MSNKKIRVTINQEEMGYETIASFEEDVISYQEQDQTKVLLNQKEFRLERDNLNLRMNYRFCEEEETEGMIEVKELDKIIKVPIKTTKIEFNKNYIEIIYYIENDQFIYRIEVLE